MEATMINDVVLEGIVVRTWEYADDLLFRLACYRDPDLPQRLLNDIQDAADFVTIRVPKGNLSAPVVEKNFHVRCTISRIAAITSRCFQSWMASAWTTKGVIG
jgi:hypothetical protein